MIIVRTLCGLMSARVSFREHFDNTLWTMGFKQSFTDRDVCMRKQFIPLHQELNNYAGSGTGTDTSALQLAPNPSNSTPMSGMPYYDYICTWVDDILTISHSATAIMQEFGSVYKLKAIDGSKEPRDPPKQYLGADYRE